MTQIPPFETPATRASVAMATIEVDIVEAMQKYGIDADWTAEGLALLYAGCPARSLSSCKGQR
jgi:hypothetical protein